MLIADATFSDLPAASAPVHSDDRRLPLSLAAPIVLGMSAGLWVLIYQGISALVG